MELGSIMEKIIGLIKGLTVLKTISLDAPASLANVVNAEVQTFINAGDGYITKKNIGAAHKLFLTRYFPAFQKDYWQNKIGQKSLESQIFDLYGFVQSHTYEDVLGERVSLSKVKDALALHWIKNHREWGELFVQSINALSYLDATKVQQGQNTISLADAYELDSNGKLKLKDGIDEEWLPNGAKFKALKERIEHHNARVNGNYAKGVDKPEAETYTLFSIFLMMKRFFVSMFQNRFASSNIKLTKYGLKSEARYNTRVGQEHGYYLKTLDLAQKELESRLQTGNWAKATPSEKLALLKSTIDIGTIIVAGLLLKYAFGFNPDDKDKYKKLKKNSWFTNQLMYQIARLQTENSTFINLNQYGGFLFDSPAVYSTLQTWQQLIKYTINQEKYEHGSGLYEKGESKAKARLFKAFGVEKVLKGLPDDDQLVIDYFKMRARQ